MVSLYGLVADPADVAAQLQTIERILPGDVRTILDGQLRAIGGARPGALSLGLLLSIAGALWAASGGMKALIDAVTIAFGVPQPRGFLRVRAVSIGYTLLGIVLLALSVLLVAVIPAVLDGMGLGAAAAWAIDVGRWPALALFASTALARLYHHAPMRGGRPRWITWGSALATVAWLGVSGLFSFYVSRFSSYNETYGAIGGVIVLLMWLFLSAFVILLGAEVDAELEGVAPDQRAQVRSSSPP
jgi:membrane protein